MLTPGRAKRHLTNFGTERLGPGLAKQASLEPQVTFHPAHEVYTPGSVMVTV